MVTLDVCCEYSCLVVAVRLDEKYKIEDKVFALWGVHIGLCVFIYSAHLI